MPHVAAYLKAIEKALAAGNATEHTHRPALKELIEALGENVTATNEPKRIRCGAPDFIVTRGDVPLGYVEAKDAGVSLDRAEESEQLRRYLDALENLLLTDYLEFRWYVRGERVHAARLADYDARRERLRVEDEGAAEVEKLITDFLTEVVPVVSSPKELAERMARVARLIRDTILRAFKSEGAAGSLHEQMKGFREVLLHDLTEEQFADMYAQTICYGLFAARVNHRGADAFTRRHAAHDLPRTNPFLRKLFQHIAGPDLDEEPHAWAVDGLAELLNRTNVGAILQDFGRSTRREDPVVHFYETFLAAYDPRMREARGVYYTPEPVVSYIVRSVDHILKADFKLRDGLADATKIKVKNPAGRGTTETHKVLILDPATGTGTFLHGVINHIYESLRENRGMWSAYVSEHLLPRLFGFELLMAPYAVAHMKLGLQLAETGYEFNTDERLRVYLTNTLEEAHEVSRMPLFTQWLAEEANAASRIKQELPIMVVIGNPPYSQESYNRGKWIEELMEDYKITVREEESQIQSLSNDYIKFIRFAQWRIDRTESGVLAFITGHGYINGPQARDMRAALLTSFDRIYVVNLHGSVRRTITHNEERDDPVFNIQQGTAITIAIKHNSKRKEVFYAEVIGPLEKKLRYLSANDITTSTWIEVSPQPPYYFFVPYSAEALTVEGEYHELPSLPEVFGTGNLQADKEKKWATGFASQQDELAISFNDNEIETKINQLLNSHSFAELRQHYRLCTTNQWNYSRAKDELATGDWRENIADCAYRPFDIRRTVFDRNIVTILRSTVMQQLQQGSNIALAASRVINDATFAHAFVVNQPTDKIFLSNKTSTNAYVFPLYLYVDEFSGSLFDKMTSDAPGGRRPNLAPEFVREIAARLKMSFVPDGCGDRAETFGPEDVFAYMYAVFHSPAYRSRYAEFLKIDFPRLPLTSDAELFRALCDAGARLVALHLLEERGPRPATFPVAGTNVVEQVRYTAPGEGGAQEGRVWINREQYFAGVGTEVWEFHVGGYQVASKWLKDRKGRTLTFDDLTHYRQVVAALDETIRLMSEIDATIEAHGGFPFG